MAELNLEPIVDDLLTIEINTIIKNEITAVSPPSSKRQVLYELAKEYDAKLKEFKFREPIYWNYAGMRSFGELRDRAKCGIKNLQPFTQQEEEKKIKILERIRDNSSNIVGMFKDMEKNAGKKEVNKFERIKYFFSKIAARFGILEKNAGIESIISDEKAPETLDQQQLIQLKKFYLSSWDEITGNDSVLKEFISKNFCIDWRAPQIEKIDDGKTIKVTYEYIVISLKLNNEKTKISLEIDDGSDGRTEEFIVRAENGKLNIYKNALPHKESEIWNNDITRQRMNQIKDLDLAPNFSIMIGKALDIGTEQIMMQTIIQIDGDVTTRISTGFLEKPSDPRNLILHMHNESINTSVRFWSTIVKTLSELAQSLFKSIMGKK